MKKALFGYYEKEPNKKAPGGAFYVSGFLLEEVEFG